MASRIPPAWLSAAFFAAACAWTGPADATAQEQWFMASRNHVESGLSVLLIVRDDGSRWVRLLDLAMLEIDASDGRRSSHAGEGVTAVDSLPVTLVLDPIGGRAHFLDRQARHLPDQGSPELLLDITVNRQPVGEPQLVTVREGELLLSPESLAAVSATELPDQRIEGLVPLHALAGELFVLDPAQMRLEMTLAPERFATTRLGLDRSSTPATPSPAPLAAIVGYDVSAGRSGAGTSSQSALFDAAVSAGNVGCRSRHLWRSSEQRVDRLDTNCTLDWPHSMHSLVVGDGVTRQTQLSPPVRYAGVRFGTDYSLQPYLYTQPVLGVDGVARLPSVLEVWIEQQLALRTDLPTGPFTLDSIPLLTGRGDVEAVVVDALGRRTLISAPFYSDPVLLRPGLSDWSIDIGRLRAGFLGDHDSYGDPFTALSLRHGLNDWLTIETRGEWREHGWLAAGGAFANLGGLGVLEVGTAQSVGEARSGWAHVLGYSYRGNRFSLGARHVVRNEDYVDMVWPLVGLAPRHESQLGLGVRIARASLSVTGVAREAGNGGRQSLVNAGLSMPVAAGYLSVSAIRVLHPEPETRYTATYTLPLSQRDTVSMRAGHGTDGVSSGVLYQRSAPLGPGYGLRAGLEHDSQGSRASLDAVLRGSRGQADASLVHDGNGLSARVGASGAVVVTGDGVFAAPDDGGSFALVSVPAPHSRVLHDNQVASVTDGNGRVLLSRVRQFERNRVAVHIEDIPMSTRIAVAEIEVVPGRRQVVEARFDAATVRYLVAELRRADGSAVAVGATARIGEATFPIGHGGLLFAELASEAVGIAVSWMGKPLCTVAPTALPPVPDPAETLALLCEDVADAP